MPGLGKAALQEGEAVGPQLRQHRVQPGQVSRNVRVKLQ